MKPAIKATLVQDYDGDICLACKGVGTRIQSTYDHGGLSLQDDYCGHCGVNWGVKTERVWKYSRPIEPRLVRQGGGQNGFARAMPRSLDVTLRDSFGIKGRKQPRVQPHSAVAHLPDGPRGGGE